MQLNVFVRQRSFCDVTKAVCCHVFPRSDNAANRLQQLPRAQSVKRLITIVFVLVIYQHRFIDRNHVPEKNFPCNSQFKYNSFKIKYRMNSVFWKRNSNILTWKRYVGKVGKRCCWSSEYVSCTLSLTVEYDNDIDQVLSTSFWDKYMWFYGSFFCCTAIACHQCHFLQVINI